ncbi:MAG: class 1 isoprenoid biosynthesis enzyme [Myxococcales bacterium]|nr:class 1 isoprenoid biosynthesis enzyme [Myxococcales bacterium]
MRVYLDNAPVIERLRTRLAGRVASYPPSLRALAGAFLEGAGPGYYSLPDAAPLLHLPIWLDRGLSPETVDDILEATALAYAYVRIQDNVLDEPQGRGHAPLMLAANAFLWDALELYRAHADARFWALSRSAWLDFSEETENERRQLVSETDYAHADFVAHARKCALAEVPLYAVMSASGEWRGVEHVVPLIHSLSRSYGCFNDVMGYERDLAAGGRTWLLAQARTLARARTGEADPNGSAIRSALVSSELMEALVHESITMLEAARPPALGLGMPAFEAFATARAARLAEVAAKVTLLRLTAALASGSLIPPGARADPPG